MTELVVCAHEDFVAKVDVYRIVSEQEETALVGLGVELQVQCLACHEPLHFRVPDVGMLSNRATRNLDGTELRVPAWIGDDPTLGADLAGFTVRILPDGEHLDPSGRNYQEPER